MTETALITTLLALGSPFWAERDVHPTVTPATTMVVNAPCGVGEAAGCAELGGSRMWLNRRLVRAALREKSRPGVGGDSARMTLCVTILHEQGHSGGVGHTEQGLMAPMATVEPWPCKVWLKRTIRAERSRKR